MELSSDYSIFYKTSSVAAGGYVHMIGEMGNIVYSYNVKDRTISVSSMPCLLRDNNVSAWAMLECRLEDDAVDFNQEEDKEKEITVVRSVVKDDDVESSHLLNIPLLEGDDGDFNQEEDKDKERAVISSLVKDDDDESSHLLNIPFHVLETIMELCVGIEYINFRVTCKRCHLAAPSIQWSNKTTRLQTYSLVSPWLMIFNKDQGIITFIDPMCSDNNNKYFITIPRELLGGYEIYYSRYGWLLMFNPLGPLALVFYNPFTSDIRKLPLVPYLESYCFSAPPTYPDCMVVGFTTCGDCHVFINFVAWESFWRRIGLDFPGDDPYSFRFPTFCGRDIYYLCNEGGKIDVFRETDQDDDDFSWESAGVEPPETSCLRSPSRYFLTNRDQSLLLVMVDEFGESIEIFILDDLGKHMIYICGTTCLCIEAKSQEMENKIYFPRLLQHSENNEKMVFYSLETRMYHTFNGKDVDESFGRDLFGTRHYRYPHAWIEPTWS